MGAGVLLMGWLALAPADQFRPDETVLGFTPEAVFARFIPAVTTRDDLRHRIWTQWTREFGREADAIALRFRTEEDWRPAYADAAILIERFLLATNLPRKGEWRLPGLGCQVEVLDRGPDGEARKRMQRCASQKRRLMLLAPQDDDAGKALENLGNPRPSSVPKPKRDRPKPTR